MVSRYFRVVMTFVVNSSGVVIDPIPNVEKVSGWHESVSVPGWGLQTSLPAIE